MGPITLEGTWEEIARRGEEWAGCKVRLTVLDGSSAPVMLDGALAHLIEDAERLAPALHPAPSGRPDDDWPEGIAEKYRRQGFQL